ncbi:hypothetical protein DSM106972_036280 [Dulcicalothrix desertica PCC 7102]|uniref:Serine/threonine protein kinase n=1 Tax=Dulcicalothrix desertica PCC 7102 TaxID=232991 RepID=A0A3S1CNY6_9CYAN|nr:AAA-like domain-containing protein [Dulcicalothrix desertica]RUT05621.1 hypothetical protein DSM106972_036280 [Dulcicalothrix desertica PCC 7102]TWH54718.1 AAA domain-containing protein [Dulcicalothrix desertica PCC 7102]
MDIISSTCMVALFNTVWQGCLTNVAYDVIEEVLHLETFILKIRNNHQLNQYLASALAKCFINAQKNIANECIEELKRNSTQANYRGLITYKPEQNHIDIHNLQHKIDSLKKQLLLIKKNPSSIPIFSLTEIEQLLASKAGADCSTSTSLIDKLLPLALENCPVAIYEQKLKHQKSGLFEKISDCFLEEVVEYELLYRIFTTLSQSRTSTNVQKNHEELLNIKKLLEDLNNFPQKSVHSKTLPSSDKKQDLHATHQELLTESEDYLLDSSFYSDCCKEIDKPGALIRVKAPLKWGKTYLMMHILNYGNQKGYKFVRVDFKQADSNVFIDSEQFLKWFCSKITDEINLSDKLDEYWRQTRGIKRNCSNYFEKYLLASIDNPLILGLDDVDLLFSNLTTAHDFFSLLRSWHEDAKVKPIWQKLRLILAYSREDNIYLPQNQSPFNVGKNVELQELSQKQVFQLVQKYKLNWDEEQVKQLMRMVGGHPYLVLTALEQIAYKKITLEEFLETAPTEEGLYGDYLLRYLSFLEDNQELLEALQQIVNANTPVKIDAKNASKLKNMGLVKSKGNSVEILCDLFRLYFKDRLEVNS